ncbi:unnamed protein product [Calypogeia fissa]
MAGLQQTTTLLTRSPFWRAGLKVFSDRAQFAADPQTPVQLYKSEGATHVLIAADGQSLVPSGPYMYQSCNS